VQTMQRQDLLPTTFSAGPAVLRNNRKAELGVELKKVESDLAKLRMSAGGKGGLDKVLPFGSTLVVMTS
jgi:hypothetical protein